jgi:zinc protease
MKDLRFDYRCVLLLLLAALPATCSAAAAQVEGLTHVRSLGGIDEYTLDVNGLRVLIKPDHRVPVATFQITYGVGSRNEVTGATGAMHLLEHMMFKGSDRFNDAAGNSIKQYVASVGGRNDANATMDRTTYFGTMIRDHIEGYIAIEADRMRNIWLRDADRRPEMTVVRNEYERGENDATQALMKQVRAMAFLAHPYHHPAIGWRSDIESISTERLKEFYDTYYWPNNATAILVGDIDPTRALEWVKRYFGVLRQSHHPIPKVYTEEPPQSGQRQFTFRRAGAPATMIIAYKIPHGLHPDLPALSVLRAILGSGANSRLGKALVDTAKASDVRTDAQPSRDPGLFTVLVRLAPGTTHEQVEQAISAEIERVRKEGVTTSELTRAVAQHQADQAYRRDGTANVAFALNDWVGVGDWTQFFAFGDAVAAVRTEDVQRVALTYLNEDRSTVGRLVPVSQ